jgi:hypothetical protein
MGPPDNYSRGGFNRFDGGKRDIPIEGPKPQDQAFLSNSDRSRENEPVDRQEEDRRGKKDEGACPGFRGRLSWEDVRILGIHVKENSQDDKQHQRKNQYKLDPWIILDAVLENDQVHRPNYPIIMAGSNLHKGVDFT